MQNLGMRPTIVGNLGAEIEILSTHSYLCRKFAVYVGKLQLPTHLLLTRRRWLN